ncbi:unnamed protein product [Rotaria magnacalcarata]|uniref:EF-hand domain-containing protein n=1 Tax=Rotaria magnacalcarata TaxID=392030 RepID=A0A816RXN6_9BILA|nr:unnamed protein product [Rotaria magnacalcarata]CAF1628327.1 unnamed protein product [Rotaria magnacalcarata]CAF2078311.1 unnamed protein product [Rotaria magnacalcarata]CAF2125189.1 unnamed protein product [Rotaria magnacalcarata]CAF2162470.1 unnamed protein product [Rotaria magnacalcarata]
MRAVLVLVVFTLIHQIYGHGEHGGAGSQATAGQPHVARKMEDYVHDTEHLRHDLEGQINKPKEQMTAEEQNFYYFKLHDTNNDNRLDGLEVVAAFDHVHQEENNKNNATAEHTPPPERLADDELIRIVDDILKEEDLDRDGYISYEEFKRAIEGNSNTQG